MLRELDDNFKTCSSELKLLASLLACEVHFIEGGVHACLSRTQMICLYDPFLGIHSGMAGVICALRMRVFGQQTSSRLWPAGGCHVGSVRTELAHAVQKFFAQTLSVSERPMYWPIQIKASACSSSFGHGFIRTGKCDASIASTALERRRSRRNACRISFWSLIWELWGT